MKPISPALWQPRGVAALEPNCLQAIRATGNTCVVAGPGAGKTEFLAQRATYLLETGLCPPQRRILAISFKTDAAKNLAARIAERCPPELHTRFDSFTFDAFTKNLLDRFMDAIPPAWRPTKPYQIKFPEKGDFPAFFGRIRKQAPPEFREFNGWVCAAIFEHRDVGQFRLPEADFTPNDAMKYAFRCWWLEHLRASNHSALTFVMINRLAELLLRTNTHFLRALLATYPFILLDEFQDTSYSQYDFLLTAFKGNGSILTAVGDDNQKIMAWAGAKPDAFACFQQDFAAATIPLSCNYRSCAELVRIQHVVAQALNSNAILASTQVPQQIKGDVAQLWTSGTEQVEANYLAKWLLDDMIARRKQPADYVLLVRQKADEFENGLKTAMASVGLRLRNENKALVCTLQHPKGRTTLQDFLTDEIADIALALLRLGLDIPAPQQWLKVSHAIERLRAVEHDDDLGCNNVAEELNAFLLKLRRFMKSHAPEQRFTTKLVDEVFKFLDPVKIRLTYLRYATGDLLDINMAAFREHLIACANERHDWQQCLDLYEGIGQIPIMTVHKSKGLEFDTVVFVGLEDDAWWAHKPGDPEGIATFFVALSRAKQRAIFTFCQRRGSSKKVAELHRLLAKAGVTEIRIS